MSEWTKTSPTSMRKAPWTVAKVALNGSVLYECWHDSKPLPVFRVKSFEEAQTHIERMRHVPDN